MSNEELVAVIQAGVPERMGELWDQVERLVSWKASRVMTALNGRGGVDFDDLYQSGYPPKLSTLPHTSALVRKSHETLCYCTYLQMLGSLQQC